MSMFVVAPAGAERPGDDFVKRASAQTGAIFERNVHADSLIAANPDQQWAGSLSSDNHALRI
jgi:hypothetical protein